jgi:hypothetical protein
MLGIIFIIALKYLSPIAFLLSPFIFGWANFVLDTIDGDLLIPLGLSDRVYQPMDKMADWVTYVFMVVVAYRYNWSIKKWILGLFVFRSIGQIAFLLSRDERVFFLIPNFLEPVFLIYATIEFFKWLKLRKTKSWCMTKKQHMSDYAAKPFAKHWKLIAILVFLYKMQDEYITHIGNIDRSDLIKRLIGL